VNTRRVGQQAVAGNAPVKRNRFIQLSGGTRSVNRGTGRQGQVACRPEGLRHQPAGLPGRTPVTAEFVIGAYHHLFQIEKSFRMAKSDLQARPI
jgi:hypothetical protein